MKQIIIFLLLIIVGFMGYNFYKKWKRFNPPNYHYQAKQSVDPNHPNKGLLMDYYKAIEGLNGYVITQWSANDIDVRNPSDDDEQTLAAVTVYNTKLGEVNYYESQLLNPIEEKQVEVPSEEEIKNKLVYDMFHSDPKGNQLRLGERGALVYEIQRLLNKKGDSIEQDGLFQHSTFNSLLLFEKKNGLLPDGRLDAITLEYLLR